MVRLVGPQRIRDDGIDLTSLDKFPPKLRHTKWDRIFDVVFLVSFLCLTLWILYRTICR